MNRRGFLTKTGLVAAGLGLSKSFHVDLMGKLSSTLLPQAHADTIVPTRVLEICFRSGIPLTTFGTGVEFTKLSMPRYSNFSYAGTDIIQSPYANSLYMSIDAKPLVAHSANIAITQGVTSQGGHTAMFNYREGGQGKGMVTPILEAAAANTTGAIVTGIQWPGAVTNSVAGKKNLSAVNSTSFVNLFKKSTLKFDDSEMQTILNTATTLSRRQALLLQDKLKDNLGQFATYQKATQMFSTDYSKLLDISDMDSSFTGTNKAYGSVRTAIAMSLKGFENNLINSAMVPIELGDWHGFQSNKQETSIVSNMAEILAATVDYLKKTPDVVAGDGKTLWDTTIIVAGSEFTRAIAPFNIDNADGQTQGLMLIGKNVNGGYYGGFTLNDSSSTTYGKAHGFDVTTGATTVGVNNTTEQMFYTSRAVMGLSLTTTEKLQVFQAMLKAG